MKYSVRCAIICGTDITGWAMTALLIKLFVKDSKNVGSERVRRAYGNLSGATGIFLNVLLAAAKIAAGAVSGAISVLADGLNNLSDCGSSAVSLVGFRMAGKPADKKHPFGHQRAEYLAALIVAMIVLVLAVELLVESVSRIITPTGEDVWSVLNVTVLSVSIGVKLWLFVFNRIIAKRIDSEAVRAASLDSLTDCLATSAVLIAVIVARYTDVNLDGYMGIVVALFIGFAGAGIFKETLGKLLGEAPDPDIIKKIRERIFTHEGVHGIHDLMVHSYGHSKYYASVHVEVDANMPMMEGHDLADRIERDFACNTDIVLVVHLDPVVLDNPKCNACRKLTEEIVAGIDPSFGVHDFRMVDGVTHTNLIFDVAIPFDSKLDPEEVKERVTRLLREHDRTLFAVPTVERNLTE